MMYSKMDILRKRKKRNLRVNGLSTFEGGEMSSHKKVPSETDPSLVEI